MCNMGSDPCSARTGRPYCTEEGFFYHCENECECEIWICAGTELPRLPALRHLNLLHCSALTDGGLAAIAAQFPHLTGLQLKAPQLTDAGLAAVSRLPELTRLDLVDCESLKGIGMRALLASLPHLHVRIYIIFVALKCPTQNHKAEP